MAKIGVWEDDRFIGAVLFGTGSGAATNGKRFGLSEMFDVAELVRVALDNHASPVSRIVSLSLSLLRKQSPSLKLIISYADPRQGHHGGIYQAGNWIYIGNSSPDKIYVDRLGIEHHSRTVSSSGFKTHFGIKAPAMRPRDAVRIIGTPGKHTYLMPMNDKTRKRILPLAKPYPKRAVSDTKDTPGVHPGEGGSTPTTALQSNAPSPPSAR